MKRCKLERGLLTITRNDVKRLLDGGRQGYYVNEGARGVLQSIFRDRYINAGVYGWNYDMFMCYDYLFIGGYRVPNSIIDRCYSCDLSHENEELYYTLTNNKGLGYETKLEIFFNLVEIREVKPNE